LNLHLWRDGDNTYHLKGMWSISAIRLADRQQPQPAGVSSRPENALLIDDPQGEWLEPRAKEQAEIFRNTTRIASFQNLETCRSTRRVAKFLKRVSRVRIERLLYRIL
jgi:CDP-diacylglycerol--serine O-phosphatidyltransferase